eukprot:GFYU01005681.1.p1 GENE.GFYU01005681.1~~GFYU01005681.1.p1  ORF type:complete len:302 (-),score=67.20 GFYU01005681.1:27-932(-)
MGDNEAFIPFGDRPEFADLEPTPQDDGPAPVVAIAYTQQFTNTMDYLRTIMKKKEKSARALTVVEEAIDLNPGNYTAWHYRREILQELGAELQEELEWVEKIGRETPKNYQLWFHRRWIIERLQTPGSELDLCETLLVTDDSKNYHIWSHRQWIVGHFNLWAGELDFVDKMLEHDVRNNSAWNHRFLVIKNTNGLTHDGIQKELEYAFSKIDKAPNNESAWNYMRGLLRGQKVSDFSVVREKCMQVYENNPECSHVVAMLIDVYSQVEEKDKAAELCDVMATSLDPIRSKYWEYYRQQVAA